MEDRHMLSVGLSPLDELAVVSNPASHRYAFAQPSPESGPTSVWGDQRGLTKSFPGSYDLRWEGRVTPVRNQGDCGSCWAHAAYGSLESSILTEGGGTRDFSENNLKNYHGFDWGPCDGGNTWIAQAYLTRWSNGSSGPIRETDDPYHPYDDRQAPPPVLPMQGYVRESWRFDTPDEIKHAVMTYGALDTGMYWDDSAYRWADCTYYYTGSGYNHEVTLVGWDDAKQTAAPTPGAWLIKNSWGTGWADQGYFWLSYADSVGGKYAVSFRDMVPASTFDHVYYWDTFGEVDSVNTPYAFNAFTAAGNEQLTAVQFWTRVDNASYEIQVYDTYTGGRLSGLLGTVSGTQTYYGHHTVDLPAPIALAAGDDFYVALHVTNGGSYPLAIDVAYWDYNSSSTAGPGQSYYSFDGTSWTDLTSWSATANFCIKALTKDVASGQIEGAKWNDLDGDGLWDQPGEPGLEGWTIYVDENRNGQWDGAELESFFDVTGPDGRYAIRGLPGGTYWVGEVQQVGWEQTFPSRDRAAAARDSWWAEADALLDRAAGAAPGIETGWIHGSGPSALANLDLGATAATSAWKAPSSSGVFNVYVEPGLLGSIQAALDVYAADLSSEGYEVTVQEFCGDAGALRAELQNQWLTRSLEGALFVGDLPSLVFTSQDDWELNPEEVSYAHDLYFMDLDGRYQLHPWGPDSHSAGSGDVGPEIYVSRITTGNLWLTGKSEAALINEYFAKVHAYRTGALRFANRGMVFADDEWSYNGGEQMAGLYGEVLAINDPAATTRAGYLNALSLDYESILECLHSWPQGHSLQVGAGWENVFNDDILAANPRQGFYNMFNCSGGAFTEADHLIGTYVYGGDYGLNAVGSTKTGSMLHFADFYAPQAGGASLGDAFRQWLDLYAAGTDVPDQDWMVDWFYGMTMQGDPTLHPGRHACPDDMHAVTLDAEQVVTEINFGSRAPSVVRFTSASQSLAESAGLVTLTVQLSAPAGVPLTVPFSVSGTATGGVDYLLATSSPITIPAGSTTGTITVQILSDACEENDETVTITLAPPAGAILGTPASHTITIVDDDAPAPRSDLVLDFGSNGTWFWRNGGTWECGARGDPVAMAAGDIDGDGRADLAIAFGSGGVWIRYADARWELLHAAGVASMAAGDLNADGRAELVIGFAGCAGTWEYTPATRAWRYLHPLTAAAIACGDLDGNGRDDVAMAFPPGAGSWIWKNESTWQLLHGLSASAIHAGDVDGDGRAELVVSFPNPNGLWSWADGGLWSHVHSATPNALALGDVNADGRQDVVMSFANGGLWEYYPWTRGWRYLHGAGVASLASGDVDGSGRDDVIAGFANNGGTWILQNGATWQHLHSRAPETMLALEMDATKATSARFDGGAQAGARSALLRSALAHDRALRQILSFGAETGQADDEARLDALLQEGNRG